jgi:pantoate--beta-alanine ligase
MCGKSRVGHFDGVETVVTKLFNLVQPNFACFGLKDVQQLFLIKKMVRDLNIPVEIIECPIVREKDGLAMSSRNKYLSESEKLVALSISKSVFAIKEAYQAGIVDTKKLFDIGFASLDKSIDLEYIEFVSANTFKQVDAVVEKTVCAIAARVGNVRLIDNIILEV